MENKEENVNFKVSSALKDLIGKDLILNDNVAIFELVKNSYDAYARKVQITFEEDKIIIADNGKGMTFEDLKNKWLFLAYSAKKDGTEDSEEDKQSSYRDLINRHYAGAKGVGRFSCDRLGESLVLITKNNNSKYVEKIAVNWNDFEQDQEKIFESIDLHHESTEELPSFPDSCKTGTILEISGIREKWVREKILNLKISLEKLINPFSETSDFEIELICENEKSRDEEIRNINNSVENSIVNGIIKNSIAKVISLKTTKIEVVLNHDTIKTILTDRDEKIYELEEANPFNKLSDVTINLYFLNTAAKTTFSKNMGVQPVNYGSVFLFRNGFRILPFGNPGDDSWKLDYRAQQGYNRFLGTRGLFGRVDVQTNNIDEFKEVSSRDGGLVESETTIQLFRLFEKVHRRLERYVVGVLWGEGFIKKEYFKNKTLAENNRQLLKKNNDSDSVKDVINDSLGSKIDFVNLVKTLINDKSVNIIYYNKNLANIFSQPTLFDDANPQVIDDLERIAEKTKDSDLLFTIEETKKKIAELEQQKKAAEERAEAAEERAEQAESARDTAQYEAKIAEVKKEQAEKQLNNKVEQLKIVTSLSSKDLGSITSLMHQINVISSNIKDLLAGFSRRTELSEVFERETIIRLLEKITFENNKIDSFSRFGFTGIFDNFNKKDNYNIVEFIKNYVNKIILTITSANVDVELIDNNISEFTTSFAPIDISIIFDNMISNAKKLKVTKMIIKMELESDYLLLSFDTNKPLDKRITNIDEIFELGISTTKSTGVGLYHIKNIATENGWLINAEERDNHVIFTMKIPGENK